MIEEAIKKKRTIRLFEDKEVPYEVLEKCVDAARLSSSARNTQPLEYIIIDDKEVLNELMPLINFGGFISEDKKAVKGKKPKALIVIIVKKGAEDYYQFDVGISAQNIALVAYENKIGSCMMGAIDRDKIQEKLDIPEDYFVGLVIAIGYAAEEPVVEESSNLEYYRKDGVLHIPKRKLKDVLHRNGF